VIASIEDQVVIDKILNHLQTKGSLPPTPELEDIRYLIARDEALQSDHIHTREYDEDTYILVAPRLEYFVYLLRERNFLMFR
jgi:hypothetical protein